MLHPRKLLKKIGPGVITGAVDDDSSGIITYSQTGAQFGYGFLWLALFTTPMMIAAQELSARLGFVTRQGLAKLISRRYRRWVVIVVVGALLVANIVNIGADLDAMAAVTRLLLPGSSIFYIIFYAAIIVILEVFISYKKYVNVLKWLALTLFAYVLAAFATHQDWALALRSTIVPVITHNSSVWMIITAILGTTISPYLFFWQASEENEEERTTAQVDHRYPRINSKSLHRVRWDTVLGMIFSNVIMFFIIVVAAGTLHNAGITNIESAAQAAQALRPIAGSFTYLLFAIGIIGAGLLAIPVLAGSAAYALAEIFGWKEGLYKKFSQAPHFYVTLAAAVILGAIITATSIPTIKFLIFAAVLNGLIAPIILWFMLKLADDKKIVGEFTSPITIKIIGWLTFGIMAVSGVLTLINAW